MSELFAETWAWIRDDLVPVALFLIATLFVLLCLAILAGLMVRLALWAWAL